MFGIIFLFIYSSMNFAMANNIYEIFSFELIKKSKIDIEIRIYAKFQNISKLRIIYNDNSEKFFQDNKLNFCNSLNFQSAFAKIDFIQTNSTEISVTLQKIGETCCKL